MVELGWTDMITEVRNMASYMAMSKEVHLDCLLYVFAYLKIKHNSRMTFDPTYSIIDKIIPK